MMDPETRFSEEEVQKILNRAVRHQERAEQAADATGYSLARLQEVAADVGISPDHLEAAAREVVLHRGVPDQRSLLGLPRDLGTVRIVPGTVTDAQWGRMVGEFRQIFGKSGIPSQFGEVREWVSTNEAGDSMPVTIRVEPGDEVTRITVAQPTVAVTSLVMGLGGAFAGTGLLLGVMMAVGSFPAPVLLLPVLLMLTAVLTVVVGWTAGRGWAGKQRDQIEKAADRAELILRAG